MLYTSLFGSSKGQQGLHLSSIMLMLADHLYLSFDPETWSYRQQVEPKVVLLELGILLLEIWHEMTLETRFSLTEVITNYYNRQKLASEWFDDMSNPLSDLYDKAVSHCIFRTVGGKSRLSDWEDVEFWRGVCGDVIEPLLKSCAMTLNKSVQLNNVHTCQLISLVSLLSTS
jgi:hypothetical protein